MIAKCWWIPVPLPGQQHHLCQGGGEGGLGLASLPAMLCHDELANGTLVSLLPEWQQPRVPIYLLFPERRLMPRKLRAFIDFLVANGPAYGIDKLLYEGQGLEDNVWRGG